ncbi:MAG: hypothetical protein LBP22_11695 [Deltaproteobacteria bacterium]|nr:hypothetical protein [Deltaproteobacteria bacterium]
MIELADYISGGKISAAEAKAKAEAEKVKAEARVKFVKSVFKMKTNNFDLPIISSVIGLSIDEIEQILN